ncbi:MAG: Mov34/MPN/PAD-1 family protein [Promethearchaeota archaeon]
MLLHPIKMNSIKNQKILISNDAIEKIIAHATEFVDFEKSSNLEVIGLIKGYLRTKDELVINDAYRIREGDETHVSFTDDDYAHFCTIPLNEEKKEFLVGWYHSHPGFGIFLSPTDLQTHALSFQISNPNLISLIFDPIRFINQKELMEKKQLNLTIIEIYHNCFGLFRIRNVSNLYNLDYYKLDWVLLERESGR